MGIENLEKYATYFGLGQKTNVELPGEISGTLAGKRLYEKLGQQWQYGNSLSAVIGQAENNFTPLQIARYIAMLANGGKKIDVTIIKDILNDDGTNENKEDVKKYLNKRLGISNDETEDLNISEDNIDVVLEGMKSVTTETRRNSILCVPRFWNGTWWKNRFCRNKSRSKCMVCWICTI